MRSTSSVVNPSGKKSIADDMENDSLSQYLGSTGSFQIGSGLSSLFSPASVKPPASSASVKPPASSASAKLAPASSASAKLAPVPAPPASTKHLISVCDNCFHTLTSPAPGNHAFLTESSVKKPAAPAAAVVEEKKEETETGTGEKAGQEATTTEAAPLLDDLPAIDSPTAVAAAAATLPSVAAAPLPSSKFMQLLSTVDVNKMNLSSTQKQQLSSLSNTASMLSNIPPEKLAQLKRSDGTIDPDKLSAEIEKERQYLMDLFALRFPDSSLAQEHLAKKASSSGGAF